MPNRVIREGILESERYWSVSIEARQMFMHMMLLADDFGCIKASSMFLRRRCFNDGPTHEKVSKLLNELQDVDLLRLYDHERTCYAFIPRFQQRLQRNTLRHPEPPESLLFGDHHAAQMFKRIKENSENPTVAQQIANRSATDGQPPEVEVEVEGKRKEKKKSFTPESSIRAQNPVDRFQVKTPTPNAWWMTEAGTDEQARKVGAYPARNGESWAQYRDRIRTCRQQEE
jgi:hypothetical protein